jgi:crotonobetainyl-CoA:carnitine CoA-transferase CaiB-like acyl-CoA transferase
MTVDADRGMLAGLVCDLRGEGFATDYAGRLLSSLGAQVRRLPRARDEHPAVTWARCGMMELTGTAGGPPQLCPLPLAAAADGALAALASLATPQVFAALRGSQLLSERAAITGFRRAGAVSPGGTCRLLDAADGSFAINLARDDDWMLVPAWLETDLTPDWESVAHAAATLSLETLLERGRLLGLAIAANAPPISPSPAWYSIVKETVTPRTAVAADATPLVIDLSSLWAGPLCSHLLQQLGARVIKLESTNRPDGARSGPARFFDLLNAGKASVALDLRTPRGREQLRALLLRADIVIEGSRPRALRQMGIHAEALIDANPRLSWIGISGYGRGEPQENWIAYGDDAGVAAGLSQTLYASTGQRLICGDAIADPLTGLHAALAAWSSFRSGGGRLISIALQHVASHCAQSDLPASADGLRERGREWLRELQISATVPLPPQAREPAGSARPLGADTISVFRELAITC